MNHPHRGKTRLFRRGIIDLAQLGSIFENPRRHTILEQGTTVHSEKYSAALEKYRHQSMPLSVIPPYVGSMQDK